LIEKYHNEVIKCIKLIYYSKTSKLSLQQKMTFFAETRHSFGHTALMLSGGATFGKFHFGVIKALLEHDLFPRTICGASVGSSVAAAICCRPYEEMNVSPS
jgi:predicted acylesterase/phospholipase RssA